MANFRGKTLLVDAIDFGNGLVLQKTPGATTLEILNGTLDAAELMGALLADGTIPLTANWDAGTFEIRANTFQSDVVTGTAPFIVASTTTVANLDAATAANATLLNGLAATAFALLAGRAGGQTLIGGTGASDNLILQASSNATQGVTIVQNSQDVNSVNILRLVGNRATPTVNDRLLIDWFLEDSVGASHNFGRIGLVANQITDGSEGGLMEFSVSCPSSGGGIQLMLDLDGTNQAVTVNPSGSTIVDFIVEASGEPNMIFVDSSLAVMGIGGLPLTGAGILQIEEDADAVSSEILRLRSTRATRAAGDEIYQSFVQPTSTGVQFEFSRITSIAQTVTNGAEEAALQFECASQFNGQGLIEYLRLSALAGEVVVNETGETIRFRVEGNTEPNLIVTVSASDNVGIGGLPVTGVILTVEDDTNTVSEEILRLSSTRATRVDNDEVFMSFYQPTDTGAQAETTRLISTIIDVTNASVDGQFELQVPQTGVLRPMLRAGFDQFGNGNISINPTLIGINFIVNGDTGTVINMDAAIDGLGFFGATAVAQPGAITQTFATADATHAARTGAVLTDNTTGAIPDATIADLTAFAASVAWDGATVFPSAADEAAIALIVTQTRDAIGELADQINKNRADLADTAQLVNFIADTLQSLGFNQ